MTNSSCTGINWLIVVGTGRSGSTSVIDTLNALPWVTLRGEMKGTIGLSIDMLKAAAGHVIVNGPYQRYQASTKMFLCHLEKWFAEMCTSRWENNPGYIGFKELFWQISKNSVRVHETKEWMTFMERVFPNARFVLNTRENTLAQSKSAFWGLPNAQLQQRLPSEDIWALLDNATSMLKEWRKHLGPQRSWWLPLSSSGFTLKQFDDLAAWLNIPCRFLSIAHSNEGSYASDTAKVRVSCHNKTLERKPGVKFRSI